MLSYQAPIRDILFLLSDVLAARDIYAELGQDEVLELLPEFAENAAKICREVALPLNHRGDEQGCAWHDRVVRTPTGFREAYRRFVEGGWIGISLDEAYGGKGLPRIFGEIFYEFLCSTNVSLSGYIELTEAVFSSIRAHGTDEQKSLFLPKLASGLWGGSMNLTEPEAGSDLGLLKTSAERRPDGTYSITGSKIFITDSEHDLTENIVNLVLARVKGAPAASRGLSLFIVPKFLTAPAGELIRRNEVFCTNLEHKMGQRASATGTVVYEGATGYLLGEPNEGLKAMFTMVNDARLGVAIQGLGLAETAFQNAMIYARDRKQGRTVVPGLRSNQPADPIYAHPDVRRMLATQRSFIEPARALALWVAMEIDVSERHPDRARRTESIERLALITPIVKSYFTDQGFDAIDQAIQCFGGHGYIEDWGLSQLLRDARVTRLYEGTNGIQALDLVGRKLGDAGGPMDRLIDLMEGELKSVPSHPKLTPLLLSVRSAVGDLVTATKWVRSQGKSEFWHVAGAASDYLRLSGHVLAGWMWIKIAAATINAAERDDCWHESKLMACSTFVTRTLCETPMLLARISSGSHDLFSQREIAAASD